jgi:hypothetical protein
MVLLARIKLENLDCILLFIFWNGYYEQNNLSNYLTKCSELGLNVVVKWSQYIKIESTIGKISRVY